MVEPVPAFIEGEVALVSEDGGEAADEHRDIELHGFEGHSADGLGCPGLVVEQQEAKALEQRGQGLVEVRERGGVLGRDGTRRKEKSPEEKKR